MTGWRRDLHTRIPILLAAGQGQRGQQAVVIMAEAEEEEEEEAEAEAEEEVAGQTGHDESPNLCHRLDGSAG